MKINGVVDITDNSAAIIAAVEAAAETALDAAGMQAATMAARELQKSPSRIDTGLLKNSITWAVSGKPAAISSYSAERPSKYTGKMPDPGSYSGTAPADIGKTKSVYIGTNVEYAIYVHDGASSGFLSKLLGRKNRMAPNRFLKNAIMNNKGELLDIMKRTLQNG